MEMAMKKLWLRQIVFGCMIVVLLMSVVYAMILVSRTPVLACTETDGGYNLPTRGLVTFITGGMATTVIDFCGPIMNGTNSTKIIHEYVCVPPMNGTNSSFVEHWIDMCPGNSTCVAGACI